MVPQFYERTNVGSIIMYDVCNRENWMKDLREFFTICQLFYKYGIVQKLILFKNTTNILKVSSLMNQFNILLNGGIYFHPYVRGELNKKDPDRIWWPKVLDWNSNVAIISNTKGDYGVKEERMSVEKKWIISKYKISSHFLLIFQGPCWVWLQ